MELDFMNFLKHYIYNDIKPKILTVNSELNFSTEQLKILWEEAKRVEI